MPRRSRRSRRRTRRETPRSRARERAHLLELIASGQPWERPIHDLDIDHRLEELLTGHDLFGLGFEDADARRAWDDVRDAFLAGHVQRHPGTRPWAWWALEAPEPRRVVRGEMIPSPKAIPWYGMPSAYAGDAVFESQGAFLRRLDLLEDEESVEHETEPDDPVTAFAREIASGHIHVGRLESAAAERHLHDLLTAQQRDPEVGGYFFDRCLADRRMHFCRYFRHYQGRWAGQVYEPAPWQRFCMGSVFGWVEGNTALRRFRISYREVARKNGKTFDVVIDTYYMMMAEGEAGAENFAVATTRDQAQKSFRDAAGIRQTSPLIARYTREVTDKIQHPASQSFFRSLASMPKRQDSHNSHAVLIDELHAHESGGMWNVMETSVGAREQPLLNAITTAGEEPFNFGGRQHTFFSRLIDPDRPESNDRIFVYIAALDAKLFDKALEEVKDPRNWRKANPNLGVTLKARDLRDLIRTAEQNPERWSDLLIKRFNFWLAQKDIWLDFGRYRQCDGLAPGEDPAAWRRRMLGELRGERCFAGLDLSKWIDLTCCALWFPDVDPPVILPFFWIPRARMQERIERDAVPFDLWERQGFLEVTDGDVIDAEHIQARLVGTTGPSGEQQSPGLAGLYDIQALAYDPWGVARQIAQRMHDEGTLETIECRQGYFTLSAPSKELEALVKKRGFVHGANPVLAWNATNCTVENDINGNIRPSKRHAENDRIDGIIAWVMALWWAGLAREKEEKRSVYEERGALVYGGKSE